MAQPVSGNASSDKKFSTREDAPSYKGGVSFDKDNSRKDEEAAKSSDAVSKGEGKVTDKPADSPAAGEGTPDKGAARSDAKSAPKAPAGAKAPKTPEEQAAADARNAEELIDAVLEAEAAAVVDEAADEELTEAEAEAASKKAEEAQAELAEWKGKYMRLHAEWDTYRRRQKEQAEEQKALAAEKLVGNLIPVIDDLERSIDYAEKNGEEGLLGGVQAVLAKFIDTLQKGGVEVIDPKGEAFEALEAQAVGTVDDPTQPDETVADVYQKGYKIGRKVLRPAMVTITQGGPKRPKDEEKEEE